MWYLIWDALQNPGREGGLFAENRKFCEVLLYLRFPSFSSPPPPPVPSPARLSDSLLSGDCGNGGPGGTPSREREREGEKERSVFLRRNAPEFLPLLGFGAAGSLPDSHPGRTRARARSTRPSAVVFAGQN